MFEFCIWDFILCSLLASLTFGSLFFINYLCIMTQNSEYNLITVVGPTASGKTTFAAHLAKELQTEIISGDSRQLYRGMDIGTGKDLSDYVVDGVQIPYHLIDIKDAGYKYSVFEFQRDFFDAFADVQSRGKLPILCGGTGMYVEAVIKAFDLKDVSPNKELRAELEGKTLTELIEILKSYKIPHNISDTETIRRCTRAIEIADFYLHNPEETIELPKVNSLVIGLDIDRELRREKISKRLKDRLDEGMIDEVKRLIKNGCPPEDLIYYGLEYKFVTQHVIGELTFDEMFKKLEIAIHQFSKRQMTWFRGMEKRGTKIHWIDVTLPMEEKIAIAKRMLTVE